MLDICNSGVGELPIPRKMPPTIMLPSVLVLDDSEDDLQLVKRVLAKAGIKKPGRDL